MSISSNKNPVEACLAELGEHWGRFRSNPLKRLLVWKVPEDAVRMLQCFFEVQKHDTEYATGDLFFVLEPSFEHSIQYSRELKAAVADQYEASMETFRAQKLPVDWKFDPEQSPDSAMAFIRCLCSFGSEYHESIGHLVGVLMPKEIANPPAFESWLARALDSNIPERLRLVVIDSIENPRFPELAQAGHERIFFDSPDIDSTAIAQKTFAQESVSGPAGVFRNLFMGLITLVEKGSADTVKMKARDAMAFAHKHGWADQKIAISMLVAGAMLKEKRFSEAVQIYQGARHAAQKVADSGHPVGKQLVLQSLFGEAGAHLAAGKPKQAAACYDQAGMIAEKIPNAIMTIEALRMGGFCHARMDSPEGSAQRVQKALDMGARLKPESRGMTTLPLAAAELLRLAGPDRMKEVELAKNEMDSRLYSLLQTLEQRSTELETANDPELLRKVEQDYLAEKEQTMQAAEQKLNALAQESGKEFSDVYKKNTTLLGPNWLLNNPIALPKSPSPMSVSPQRIPPL